ncbi:MDR family MFS transporter [Gorillibacterium massiliense]|uniref:MDR family MFS transporter n=1 Tax=Gorillibacterium massiliense TaxID=1280390 RepID=UPI0004AF5311|nr:MDR family MFS transporter [Gorillibacterium massiliense]
MMQKGSNLKLVVTGLLLGILMSAMDNTIVATSMGTIVSELGNYDKFIWVTSAYMVATMAGMPIFGKLSDMYGRKRFFVFGLIMFLLGSALCGLSQTMVQLSIFRAIQGIGGGALMPIAFTIIFDIFPPQARGKMTGLFGAVFGASSVLGPLLGAYITDNIKWNWIFYVNLPIGIVALFLILRFYKESPQHVRQKIDWWGASTLVISVVSLMFALELGGEKGYPWDGWKIIGLFVVFAVFFVAFFLIERVAKEPIISFWLFKKRLFATSQILALLYGATFIILTVFIPIFVSAVYGGTATNAGLILMPMMIGSVVGSSIGGIFQTRTTFRNLMIVSVITFFVGMLMLGLMTPDTHRWMLTIFMTLAGFGVGFSFSMLPTASMHNLDPRFRGTATSTNSFLRSFGMTLGITIFGTIQSNLMSTKMTNAFKDMAGGGQSSANFSSGNIQELFKSGARSQIPADILHRIVGAMSDSITGTFLLALIPIGVAAVVVLLMGNARIQATPKEAETSVAPEPASQH